MSLECFLNELSFSSIAPDVNSARERMFVFVKTLAQANHAAKKQLPLRVSHEFFGVTIAPEYSLVQWRNDVAVDRDIRAYFNSITTKSPLFDSGTPNDRALKCEATFGGVPAIGMLAAFLNDGMTVSVLSDLKWDCASLCLIVSELDENADIISSDESLRHIARAEHIREHEKWIAEQMTGPIRSHAELWAIRTEQFESLEFCDQVREQFAALPWDSPQSKQAIKRLQLLNSWWADCIRGSLPHAARIAVAPCKLSPESQATLDRFADQHTFMCPDGNQRLFSSHVRFTPGAGRIYFTWADEGNKLIIGHIGKHLPTVEHPH